MGREDRQAGRAGAWLRAASLAWLAPLAVGLALSAGALSSASAASETRTSSFDYDPASGLLSKEVVEPGDSALCLVKEYTLDAYGQRTKVTTRNCNGSAGRTPGAPAEAAAPAAPAAFVARSTSVAYTADQRFVASTTNALAQSETSSYDSRFGVVTRTTGPNQLTTAWAYDDLGRKIIEKQADGNGTRWSYEYCSGVAGGIVSCPVIAGIAAAYLVTETPVAAPIDLASKSTGAQTGPYKRAYHDALGRVIRLETQGADIGGASRLTYQDTEYNALGQVARKSNPYYAGDASYWTSYSYDTLSRVVSENRPTDTAASGAITTTVYNGLTVSVTDPRQQTTRQTMNALRQVRTVTDALGGTLQKSYDPHGNLVRTVDAKGNVISLVYDRRGRKTAQYDPDLGVWSYSYNALGELVSQTNARGQSTQMAYDLLGRLTQRTEPTLSTTWHYDKYANNAACSKGIGKLCQVVSNNGHSRRMVYDSLGRLSSTTTTLGTALTASVSYDTLGRVSTQTYPSGLAVRNNYTALGFLQSVVDTRSNAAVWTATSTNAAGQLVGFTHGNGVATLNTYSASSNQILRIQAGTGSAVQHQAFARDEASRLTTRTDHLTGVVSAYSYDALNRLTREERYGGAVAGVQAMAWTYDAIGNMLTRTERGNTNTYNYNTSGSGSRLPHAVMSVSGTVNGYAVPRYQYDANGNMTSGAGRTVTWTSFDKVETMAGAGVQLQYVYDEARERAQERYYSNGVLQRTTLYLNPAAGAGLYYEEEQGTAGMKKKHYIAAGSATVAMIVCTANPCTVTANTSTQYWHKDHLGSLAVVTNAAGVVIERLSYEPFGKRRQADGQTDVGGMLAAASTDRGFTGHEHIQELGLINMNGRIYDPGLGRFMSADPYIQSPDSLQSYNRYSYLWNDPLNGTDPTGYFSLKKFLRMAVSMVAAYYMGPAAFYGNFGAPLITAQMVGGSVTAAAIANGAVAGFISSAISSGSLKGAAQGAFSGALFASVGAMGAGGFDGAGGAAFQVGAHAGAGCISAAVSGASCGAGALSAGVAKFATINGPKWIQNPGGDLLKLAGGVAYTAIIGGTASVIGGGKFGNGAQTGAFGYLFNQVGGHGNPGQGQKPGWGYEYSDVDHPFAPNDEFKARFFGSEEERRVWFRTQDIASGTAETREWLRFDDPKVQLPRSGGPLYQIFDLGLSEAGAVRIAYSPKFPNVFYVSLDHYKPTPAQPLRWTRFEAAPPKN